MVIAIFKDKQQLYFTEEKNNNDLSIKLLPKIKEIIEQLNLYITDIEMIFVVNGPGSFTGIRIGLTVAKTLAWSLNIPIIPISELELLATTEAGKYVAPMIDARRDYVYAGLYTSNLDSIIKDEYILKSEFLNKIKEYIDDVTFVSYDSFSSVDCVTPKINVSKIVEKYINSEGAIVHTLLPNYLKKTEAEEKREH
jgi:tRNA threonylcarbamoyladenosine biosynthesis protein TsaB